MLQCAILHHSVMSDSLQRHGLQPTRLLWSWDSPGKNTGEACHALLQGIFPTQGLNPGLLHYKWILYRLSHQGSPHGTMDAVVSRMRRETSDMFGEHQGRLPGESNLLWGPVEKLEVSQRKGGNTGRPVRKSGKCWKQWKGPQVRASTAYLRNWKKCNCNGIRN